MQTSHTYAYIRVSSKEQNEDRQLDALAGFSVERLYIDKQSGKDFNRPAYQRMLRRIKKGDLLIIGSIDRLGRNYEEILRQWRILTKEKRADILVVDMPLLDTRRGKDLMGTFIADLVLQLLSFVAENERASIRRRQAEGIAAAKARGVKFGREKRELPAEFAYYANRWYEGSISSRRAAEALKIPATTFRRRAQEIGREKKK